MPATVGSFYKTRITNTGIFREKETYAVQIPRDDSSCSDSSDEEHDELDSLNNDTEQELTESNNDDDCTLATLQRKIKPTVDEGTDSGSSGDLESDEEEKETAAKKRKTTQKRNTTTQTRW